MAAMDMFEDRFLAESYEDKLQQSKCNISGKEPNLSF
jgi:hypothetical protein